MIYKFKTEGIVGKKDFRDYGKPLELSKYLRDGDIHPKEVLKSKKNLKIKKYKKH